MWRPEANGARWPSRSSKSVAPCSRGGARFDSEALPPFADHAHDLSPFAEILKYHVGAGVAEVGAAGRAGRAANGALPAGNGHRDSERRVADDDRLARPDARPAALGDARERGREQLVA